MPRQPIISKRIVEHIECQHVYCGQLHEEMPNHLAEVGRGIAIQHNERSDVPVKQILRPRREHAGNHNDVVMSKPKAHDSGSTAAQMSL